MKAKEKEKAKGIKIELTIFLEEGTCEVLVNHLCTTQRGHPSNIHCIFCL